MTSGALTSRQLTEAYIARMNEIDSAGPSLHAVIAQRLVRRLCAECTQAVAPTGAALGWLRVKTGESVPSGNWQQGAGCHACSNTGFKGRIGVYEMLSITPAMSTALAAGDFVSFASLGRASAGFRSLELAALDYAIAGVTSVSEAMRVAAESLLGEDDAEDVPLLPPSTAASD